MRIDMHVHTNRHSSCSRLTPEQAVEACRETGTDGLVLTEHDYFWTREELHDLQKMYPETRLFRGIEVNSSVGHVLLYGIESAEGLAPGMPLAAAVDEAHAQGGVAAIAHVCRYTDDLSEEILPSGIDAIETMSTNIRAYMQESITHVKKALSLPGICGSDSHSPDTIGLFTTEFADTVTCEADLAWAIRSGAVSCHADRERVDALNAGVDEMVRTTKELMARGMDKREIKRTHRIAFSFQYGVETGKNMHFAS